jgi:uncharacterized repeat protein (TIGR01451 family)
LIHFGRNTRFCEKQLNQFHPLRRPQIECFSKWSKQVGIQRNKASAGLSDKREHTEERGGIRSFADQPHSAHRLRHVKPALRLALGLAGLSVSSVALAAPLTCTSIYATDNGGKPVFEVNTTTAALTNVATLPVASQIGIAVLPGATPTLYSDAASSPLHLQSTNGTTTTNTAAATFAATYGGGLGVTTSNQLFYMAKSASRQYIWRFPSVTAASAQISITTGDTVWNALSPGDMMSDANGRLYYFGSDGSNTGKNNFLYYVDSTNTARRLGVYVGPSAGVGVAFDPSGTIYTIHGSALYKIDMTAGFTATSVGTAKLGGVTDNLLIDLASCALPNMNPVIAAVKTVKDVTTNQSPALVVNTNDVLEYSTLYTNSGNLPSDNTRFIDTIPPGTAYVLASTKMCNATGLTCTAVADVAGAAPFLGAGLLVNSPGQAAGIVFAGAGNAAMVKFQTKVTSTGTPATINNTAQATYPTVASAGVITTNIINTNATAIPFNFPNADLVVTKSNGTSAVTAGSATLYTLTITNNGPAAATGALIKDAPGAGITCPAANPVTISGSGIPAGSFTVGDLTGAGITLGTLTATQSATLSYSCQIN